MTEEKGNQEVREASEIETVDDLRECYEDCLDRGNEIGMSAALSRIRDANQKIETSPNFRDESYGKISGLEDEYKNVMRISQQRIREAEANKNQAEKDWREVESKGSWLSGIRGALSNLQNLIVESGKVKSVSEDQAI